MIHVPLIDRPIVALDALGFYLIKVVFPIRLVPDYGRTPQWLLEHPAAALTIVAPAIVG